MTATKLQEDAFVQQRALKAKAKQERNAAIARLARDGLNNAEIGAALNLDVKTVRRVRRELQ